MATRPIKVMTVGKTDYFKFTRVNNEDTKEYMCTIGHDLLKANVRRLDYILDQDVPRSS